MSLLTVVLGSCYYCFIFMAKTMPTDPLVEAAQPAAAQRQAGQEFAAEPQLRFAAFGRQAVETDDQAAAPGLPFMGGE